MKSVSVLNNIHNDFKHIGPAPVDKQEALWNRLKNASNELYKNKKKFISNIKNILNENLDKKNELLTEVKSFSNLKFLKIYICFHILYILHHFQSSILQNLHDVSYFHVCLHHFSILKFPRFV